MSPITGVRFDRASKRSRSSATPARRAIAIRCTTALVDPPIAMVTVTALSNASAVMIVFGVTSSQIRSTTRRPAAAAMRGCAESAAGIDDAPGIVMPRASAAAAIVEAVPIVMHVP